jgi:hypothetical protein
MDIRFEQRHSNLFQSFIEVLFAEFALTTQVLEDAL